MRIGKKRRKSRLACNLGASGDNIIGYCTLHKSCMSKKQMQNRKCLEKQCKRFAPRKDHPYWRRREEIKEAKRARKEALRDGDGLQTVPASEAGV